MVYLQVVGVMCRILSGLYINDKESKMTDVDAGRMYADGNDLGALKAAIDDNDNYIPEMKSIEQYKLDHISSLLQNMLLSDDCTRWRDLGPEFKSTTPNGTIQICYNIANLTDEEFIHAFIQEGRYNLFKEDHYPADGDYSIRALLRKDVKDEDKITVLV